MLYSLVMTVPPKTTDIVPLSRELPTVHRRITHGVIRGLDDCGFRVGARLVERGRQIAPAGLGSWIMVSTAGTPFSGYMLTDPPSLTCVGYNYDDTYTHRILFEVEIE